ncbi:MAG: hypothetical protein WB384_21610, partial [Candidatus Sulfotelmatobacter sp.]
WYQQDKGRVVTANQEASNLLQQIVNEVIGHRRTRAFLLQTNERNLLIDALFDARVLHLRRVQSRRSRGDAAIFWSAP